MKTNKRSSSAKTSSSKQASLTSSHSKQDARSSKRDSSQRPPQAAPSTSPIVKSQTLPLHILMVLDQFNIGGTETYTLSLTRELLRQGVKVTVAGKQGKLLQAFIGLGCPVYELDFVLDNHEPNTEREQELMHMLSSIVERNPVHIIHAHQFPSGKIAKAVACAAHIPFVFTVHGTYYDHSFLDDLKDAVIISVSPAVERMLRTNGIRSYLIPNGIDTGEYQARSEVYREHLRKKLGLPSDALIALYASRLSWEKAEICKQVIHAASALRNFGFQRLYMIIVGDGKDEKMLTDLAKQEHLLFPQQVVTFVGETTNIHAYYQVADCVIGTGRVALEAMASMLPFIAYGTKGYIGAIQPSNAAAAWDSWFGDHGATPEAFTIVKFMSDIERILNVSEQERRSLAQWGREHVHERYHITNVTRKLLDTYQEAVTNLQTAKNA